ncbi:hypothetical protein ACJ73_06927 [Blastomyces percursus]|uniref:Carbohydrate kinase PfkB domain-containing protein n=1 Tax=Blastomyces percursus TaxID=1658174 RepID=A0A1J9QNF1_9EURO|nr:hypothetical protein ACJ73_06927 [Blastomyces percursus]
MFDVFSPNHLELLNLGGKPLQPVPDNSEIELLAQRFIDSGVGSEGAGTVITSLVDPTGARNTFLGAYAVGFLRTGDPVKLACFGSIGASFALEQVGLPAKSNGAEEQ